MFTKYVLTPIGTLINPNWSLRYNFTRIEKRFLRIDTLLKEVFTPNLSQKKRQKKLVQITKLQLDTFTKLHQQISDYNTRLLKNKGKGTQMQVFCTELLEFIHTYRHQLEQITNTLSDKTQQITSEEITQYLRFEQTLQNNLYKLVDPFLTKLETICHQKRTFTHAGAFGILATALMLSIGSEKFATSLKNAPVDPNYTTTQEVASYTQNTESDAVLVKPNRTLAEIEHEERMRKAQAYIQQLIATVTEQPQYISTLTETQIQQIINSIYITTDTPFDSEITTKLDSSTKALYQELIKARDSKNQPQLKANSQSAFEISQNEFETIVQNVRSKTSETIPLPYIKSRPNTAEFLKLCITFTTEWEGGFYAKAYQDSRGFWTIGIGSLIDPKATTRADIYHKLRLMGHTGNASELEKIRQEYIAGTRTLTRNAANNVLQFEMQRAHNVAKEVFSNFESLPTDMQVILVDMIFNMGETNARSWNNTQKLIANKDFKTFGESLPNWRWFKQTGRRARVIYYYIICKYGSINKIAQTTS